MRVSVNDDGSVESASNIDLKCEVDGGSQILWIAPLGEEVKKGDVLVRLNSSAVQEEITEQRIVYEKANAELIKAETDLAVAAIALKEYEEGTFVKEQQTAEANIVIARENLKSSENLAAHNERMFRKGYINRLQLEASQFAVERAKLDLDTMLTAKQVLVEFTRPKMVKELRSKQSAAEATFAASKAAAELEKFKLDELQVQLEKCVIKAPQDGMVVYANQREGRRGESLSTIEEGAQVREMQSIIQLPDLGRMQVNTLIHETKIDKIRAGMPATIRIRGRELQGAVKFVNNQPEPGNWFSSDVKEYAAKVSIDSIPAGVVLKPGMTAEVEILVRELADALQVPLMAVVQEGLESVCYVKKGESVERRKVTIGDANTSFLEIRQGLDKGEEVILNPGPASSKPKNEASRHSCECKRMCERKPGKTSRPNPPRSPASKSAKRSHRRRPTTPPRQRPQTSPPRPRRKLPRRRREGAAINQPLPKSSRPQSLRRSPSNEPTKTKDHPRGSRLLTS